MWWQSNTTIISIHALLAESDVHIAEHASPGGKDFYPRSPCGERPGSLAEVAKYATISIHALLAESDWKTRWKHRKQPNFYPRSPCGERLHRTGVFVNTFYISIHALLAESDQGHNPGSNKIVISIHALLAESDFEALTIRADELKFLSTLSLRRATARGRDRAPAAAISIHALLAESDVNARSPIPRTCISIHALLAESDNYSTTFRNNNISFLSTLSLRRATYHRILLQHNANYFYPRSPCGERRKSNKAMSGLRHISIHALLAESDT